MCCFNSLLWLKSGYTVKYSLSPREIPRAPPSGFPLCSGHISPYIPLLVKIQTQYLCTHEEGNSRSPNSRKSLIIWLPWKLSGAPSVSRLSPALKPASCWMRSGRWRISQHLVRQAGHCLSKGIVQMGRGHIGANLFQPAVSSTLVLMQVLACPWIPR